MVRVKHAAIIARWSILGTVVALMIAVSALLVISTTGGQATKTGDPSHLTPPASSRQSSRQP
jgi:hypothetical protein